MKRRILSSLMLLSIMKAAAANEYLTFYLGGQSNMDGYGYVTELPDTLINEQDVMIFHGNGVFDNQNGGGLGKWSKVKPGHGTGFTSDGTINNYSNRFGPELSFAASLTKLYPNKKIAIIKYSVGGTGLHLNTGYGNWSPDFQQGAGKNQYDFALNTLQNAFSVSDINGDGKADTLVPAGIIWMQGEADAHSSQASANAYLTNLTRLMGLIRAALRKDDIPIILGKITDSEQGDEDLMPYIKRIHLAQQLFVEQDICAGYMTDTDNYEYGEEDAWHYLSPGYIRMGEEFANTYASVVKGCESQH